MANELYHELTLNDPQTSEKPYITPAFASLVLTVGSLQILNFEYMYTFYEAHQLINQAALINAFIIGCFSSQIGDLHINNRLKTNIIYQPANLLYILVAFILLSSLVDYWSYTTCAKIMQGTYYDIDHYDYLQIMARLIYKSGDVCSPMCACYRYIEHCIVSDRWFRNHQHNISSLSYASKSSISCQIYTKYGNYLKRFINSQGLIIWNFSLQGINLIKVVSIEYFYNINIFDNCLSEHYCQLFIISSIRVYRYQLCIYHIRYLSTHCYTRHQIQSFLYFSVFFLINTHCYAFQFNPQLLEKCNLYINLEFNPYLGMCGNFIILYSINTADAEINQYQVIIMIFRNLDLACSFYILLESVKLGYFSTIIHLFRQKNDNGQDTITKDINNLVYVLALVASVSLILFIYFTQGCQQLYADRRKVQHDEDIELQ